MNFSYHLTLYAPESLTLFNIKLGKNNKVLFYGVLNKLNILTAYVNREHQNIQENLAKATVKIEELNQELQKVLQNLKALFEEKKIQHAYLKSSIQKELNIKVRNPLMYEWVQVIKNFDALMTKFYLAEKLGVISENHGYASRKHYHLSFLHTCSALLKI